MIKMILFDKDIRELKFLKDTLSSQVAYQCDEKCEIEDCHEEKTADQKIKTNDLADLTCLDLMAENGVDRAAHVRCRFPETDMMVIADVSVSPLMYMKPGIRASSLVLRPVDVPQAVKTVKEFIASYLDSRKEDTEDQFVIETKEGIQKVPYHKICYFEARMKKLYVRTDNEELAFYDTLDCLGDGLSKSFVRCHRGYIVNGSRISRIITGQNEIVLDNDMIVPISRSYKTAVMWFVK